MSDPVLAIDDFALSFATDRGPARVLDGVSLTVTRGETLGLVGESGCGKSVTGLSAMRLIPDRPGTTASGDIRLEGQSLTALTEAEMRRLRGSRIAMIFQDPMVSLNPLMRIGDQIAEAIRLHQPQAGPGVAARVTAALAAVGIGDAARRARAWPHQFSGGMRQRAMIAMMLACRPALLIDDEPTTALDVTVQAQVLDLIRALQAEQGMAVLLITHNLGVVAEVCDRVAVMYAGTVVETAPVAALFARPQHPYTRALLGAIPRADADSAGLAVIPGRLPDLTAPPPGCRFHPRCPRASDLCRVDRPANRILVSGHSVACHHPGEGL
jgi:oligopeptide/dipeptide ABC transporter ATP-binding protein